MWTIIGHKGDGGRKKKKDDEWIQIALYFSQSARKVNFSCFPAEKYLSCHIRSLTAYEQQLPVFVYHISTHLRPREINSTADAKYGPIRRRHCVKKWSLIGWIFKTAIAKMTVKRNFLLLRWPRLPFIFLPLFFPPLPLTFRHNYAVFCTEKIHFNMLLF